MITYHFQEIGKGLEFYTSNYGKILLIGDFNSEMSETSLISSLRKKCRYLFWCECRKMRIRITPNTDTLYGVSETQGTLKNFQGQSPFQNGIRMNF